jgi:RNA polymerase sigma-70 factor (ECF subfamily)
MARFGTLPSGAAVAKNLVNDSSGDGDIALVQELFIKESPRIRAFLLGLVPDLNRVDDLMHGVFLTITEKAHQFDRGRDFVRWATGIAKIELLRQLRENQKLPQAFTPEIIERLCVTYPVEESSMERLDALAACMETLAPRARKMILLRYFEALLPGEIASRMSLSAESVHVTLSRARNALRKCVERKLRLAEGK